MTQISQYNPSIYVVGLIPYLPVRREEPKRREAPKVQSIEDLSNETPQNQYQRHQKRDPEKRLDLLA